MLRSRIAPLGVVIVVVALVLPVHADGLPGEFLLSPYWRILTGIHSPLSNPAFMMEENYASVRGVYAPVMQREFRLSEIGVTIPIGMYQTAGISWFGQFDGQATQGFLEDDGSISPAGDDSPELSNSNHAFLASYAINPFHRLSLGANLTYALQTNFGEPVSGLGLDFGATFRVISHPLIGYHLVGISTINFLAPSMSSGILPKFGNRGEYSRSLRFSWHATYLEELLTSAIDFELKDFMAAAGEFQEFDSLAGSGGGWKQIPKKIEYGLNTRIGAWLFRRVQSYLLFGFDQDALDYWGLSAGARVPSINEGRDLSVQFQYTMKTAGDNSSAFSWYVFGEFGPHREEMLARRLARLSQVAPNDLYNKAMSLYKQERYWDAFFVFSQILSEFPDFFKNDWVVHYRGRCEEELDMRENAIEHFNTVVTDYSKSPAVPYSDLALVRLSYRQDDPEMILKHFNRLSRPGVPDSVRFHGMYYYAESLLGEGKYRKAIQFFSTIPETHPEFPFAQHSLAVAHVLAGDPMPAIIQALGRAAEIEPRNKAEEEIRNRSLLLFGFLFYEESMLSKAVMALRQVDRSSIYFPDAQLGLGWAAIRAKQWNDAVEAGKNLIANSSNKLLQAEGGLVQAYGLMMTREYTQALALLAQSLEKAKSYKPPTEEALTQRSWQYQNTRISYGFLAGRVEELSMKSTSEYTLRQIDSLHQEQLALHDSIKQFLDFRDDHARESFFSRGYEQTLDDLNYAWATVQKYAMEYGEGGQGEILKEQEKIEQEMEQLRKEMEQLKKEERYDTGSPPEAE